MALPIDATTTKSATETHTWCLVSMPVDHGHITCRYDGYLGHFTKKRNIHEGKDLNL